MIKNDPLQLIRAKAVTTQNDPAQRTFRIMTTLVEHLQPTLWICNLLGITYISSALTENTFWKSAEQFLPLPFFGVYIMIVVAILVLTTFAEKSTYNSNTIVAIGDVISTAGGVICMCLRAIYYRCKMRKTKKLILEVNLAKKLVVVVISLFSAE